LRGLSAVNVLDDIDESISKRSRLSDKLTEMVFKFRGRYELSRNSRRAS
jgi:hypothetical protein